MPSRLAGLLHNHHTAMDVKKKKKLSKCLLLHVLVLFNISLFQALLPLVNCPLIDYTLEFLASAGMQEFMEDLGLRFNDKDHCFIKVLKGWFWGVFNTDEDVADDVSTTVTVQLGMCGCYLNIR